MATLGLDISTSCTGWCVIPGLENGEKKIQMGFIDLAKTNGLFQKAKIVKEHLSNLHILYDISDIFIEENLQSFRSGFSSAQTLSTLARFNGIVSYLCFDQFGFEPKFLNVNSARKMIGLKIIRSSKGGAPVKEQVLEWAKGDIDTFDWPTKTLKSGPRKGLTICDPRCYDIADAYVIAQAGLLA
tara:strand:+ start:106 stop:660 length:555 start_codon:yes stop_codon:yes gene_type:complete